MKQENKTYSREFSLILFLHLVYLSIEVKDLFEVVVWPYVSFWIYAFGSKQPLIKEMIDKKVKENER